MQQVGNVRLTSRRDESIGMAARKVRGIFEKSGEDIGIPLNVVAGVRFDRAVRRTRTNR